MLEEHEIITIVELIRPLWIEYSKNYAKDCGRAFTFLKFCEETSDLPDNDLDKIAKLL